MSTFHTLPSGKIIYKVKGSNVYSIYGPDDRTHLVSLSGEDLSDMAEAMRLLDLAELAYSIDPNSKHAVTEAADAVKDIAGIRSAHLDGGVIITYKDGTEKYFEEKGK